MCQFRDSHYGMDRGVPCSQSSGLTNHARGTARPVALDGGGQHRSVGRSFLAVMVGKVRSTRVSYMYLRPPNVHMCAPHRVSGCLQVAAYFTLVTHRPRRDRPKVSQVGVGERRLIGQPDHVSDRAPASPKLRCSVDAGAVLFRRCTQAPRCMYMYGVQSTFHPTAMCAMCNSVQEV